MGSSPMCGAPVEDVVNLLVTGANSQENYQILIWGISIDYFKSIFFLQNSIRLWHLTFWQVPWHSSYACNISRCTIPWKRPNLVFFLFLSQSKILLLKSMVYLLVKYIDISIFYIFCLWINLTCYYLSSTSNMSLKQHLGLLLEFNLWLSKNQELF